MSVFTSAFGGRYRSRMAILLGALLALMMSLLLIDAGAWAAEPVFINELHYDNDGTDTGEAIEVAGPAGTDLSGWSIVLYNGSNGAAYNTTALTGTIPNTCGGYGVVVVSYPTNGIQNGAPDGVALVDAGNNVVQFLSYEGTLVAVGGPADGLASIDIGVAEAASTPIGESLQLTGTGTVDEDFTWAGPVTSSFGACNPGQTFAGSGGPTDPLINEFVNNHVGTDTHEYIEVWGDASSDYSGFTVLEIDGDSTSAGVIDDAFLVGTTDVNGFWATGFVSNLIENGTVTLLLVEDFTGSSGDDLDSDDDGILDTTPWARLVDGVGVDDGGTSDHAYSDPILTGDFDGVGFTPGGASRIPNGADTDTISDWVRNDFDGEGLPGFVGTPDAGEALNTPGAENAAVPAAAAFLMINEIDYDQPSTDTAEFIELKNADTVPVNLDDYSLQLVNGNGASVYITVDLPAFMLAPGGYYVVCADAATVQPCDLDVLPDSNLIQNGAPDAVALVFDGQVIDSVSYEGDTDAPYTEGSGTGLVDDPNEPEAGLSRLPDGVDTNQNNVDFSFRCDTPGEVNTEASTDCSIPPSICDATPTLISAVQGSGTSSPLAGQVVTIRGVVVGDLQDDVGANGDFDGFFIQEEAADSDGDSATSEGIFVYQGSNPILDVVVGDLVAVRGQVVEYSELTELTNLDAVEVCGTGYTISPALVSLPVPDADFLERFEGMAVSIPQTLTVSENYNLGRYGEVVLSNGRLYQATQMVTPGPAAIAYQAANNLNRIVLDDGLTIQNPDPVIHPSPELSALNTLRSGDTVTNLTGVLTYAFDAYRVQPTTPPVFVSANPRTPAPNDVGGTVRVASFNVLNYFTTIDTGPDICGPAANLDCRGADSVEEFERQRAKIIEALLAIDADVVGLIELENNATASLQDLVDGLNAVAGAGTYAYIDTGTIGTDAIKVGIIYQPAVVTPVGAFAVLDSSVDPTFIDTLNRPVLVQTFEENATSGAFTVAVSHLKSKSSACDDIGDPDTGDGQGNCNLTRTSAAQALVNWLATDPTGSGDTDFLIIGDMNAYAQEDPVAAIESAGYTNLVESRIGNVAAYSYIFSGEAGYLDHVLASPGLTSQVTGVTEWHINADEPHVLDYNTEYKSPDQVIGYYNADPYRASDHDPVLIGFSLMPSCTQVASGDVAGLISAIEQVNIDGEGTICLAAGGTYDLVAADNHMYGQNGLPAITGDLRIIGNNATIAREHRARAFRYFYVAPQGSLELENLTLSSGGRWPVFSGGAVYNRGSVHLSGVTLSHNEALLDGGAVYNTGRLIVENSTLIGNEAGWRGGGIFNRGSVTIIHSIIDENSARWGGGVYTSDRDVALTLTGSTVIDNEARLDGGGIYNGTGTVLVFETEFVSNQAGQQGGAFYNGWGSVDLRLSAFIDNSSRREGGALYNSHRGDLVVTDGTFTGNTSRRQGNALYNLGDTGVRDSCFDTNLGIGASVYGTRHATTDAAYNWWGAADGPSGAGLGSGDAVGYYVLYEPFVTDGCPAGGALLAAQNPLAPAGQNLVRNGDFADVLDYWLSLGTADVVGEVLWLGDGSTLSQELPYTALGFTPFSVELALGNASSLPQTVVVSLRNAENPTEQVQCVFPVPANLDLSDAFVMRVRTPGTWPAILLDIEAMANGGGVPVEVDDVSVQVKQGQRLFGPNQCAYIR